MTLFIPYYISKKERINKLVLSGGSTKGIAYIGIIKGLEENNLLDNFKTFAGVSVGAIFSFLLSIGFHYVDFMKMMNEMKLSEMLKITNNFTNYGFDSGNNIVCEIKKIMDEKKIKYDITFKELFEITNKRLIIVATNLTQKKAVYFDHKRSPDMSVLIALRMSFSIPIIFSPIMFKGECYVDGGLVDDLPFSIFKNKDKCLNIYIDGRYKVDTITNYLFALFDFISSVKNIEDQKIKNIIIIDIQLFCTNFNLSQEDIQKIIECGYKKIIDWLK